MATTNLAIAEVAANQNQKEVTINDGLEQLDTATQGQISYTVTGDFTVSSDDFTTYFNLLLEGTPGAGFTVSVPASKRFFFVTNDSDSDAIIQVTGGAGTPVTISAGDQRLLYNDGADIIEAGGGSGGGGSDTDKFIAWFVQGQPGAGELVMQYVFAETTVLPASLTGSQGYALTAPSGTSATTSSTTSGSTSTSTTAAPETRSFDLQKNGVSVGTVDFAPGSNTATFTFTSEVTFAAGDRLACYAPAEQDAQMANVSITLKASTSATTSSTTS